MLCSENLLCTSNSETQIQDNPIIIVFKFSQFKNLLKRKNVFEIVEIVETLFNTCLVYISSFLWSKKAFD